MRRQLSSKSTFWIKCIFPPFWICGFAATTVGLFTGVFHDANGNPPPPQEGWIFLAATVLGSVILYVLCMRLKAVWLEDGMLCVSNFLHSQRIPLAEIESVRNLWGIHPESIVIRFAQRTRFGKSIRFMPAWRWFKWGGHPLTNELQAAVELVRRRTA